MSRHPVQLYIYDLSGGLAAQLSPILLGKKIDGIWHTSIVVYAREYFFGSGGIESCNPGETALGPPLQKVPLGETELSYTTFFEYIKGLRENRFAGNKYNLFEHNCNNFSQELAQFLCGASIPKYILDLPSEVLRSNLLPAISALVQRLEQSARPIADEERRTTSVATSNNNTVHHHQSTKGKETSPEFDQLNHQIDEVRYTSFVLEQRRKTLSEKLARKERKKAKRSSSKKHSTNGGTGTALPVELQNMATAEETDDVLAHNVNGDVSAVNGAVNPDNVSGDNLCAKVGDIDSGLTAALDLEEEERREEEQRKKNREPPVIYKDLPDAKVEFDALLALVDGKLSESEKKSMEELQQYLVGDEGSWALGDGFLTFIGRILENGFDDGAARLRILNLLSIAALKDDIILLLHQDRKDHILMNFAQQIDRHPIEVQQVVAILMANLFENLSSSEWLMYISEWTFNGQQCSNIRVTTKVAVHCLLADSPVLQDCGTAIIHNLACKEVKSVVFDDIAVELTMALLQYFQSAKPDEEHLFRTMKALARFVHVSGQEVPQLIAMIGPHPNTMRGASDRIDALISDMSAKLKF